MRENDDVMDQHHAELIITPAMNDPSRIVSRSSSVFSLVATLVGGGCLSLPGAFAKVGVGLGTFYLFGAGLMSAFSISLLLSCSRRTGAANYEEVALISFGHKTKYAVMVLLIMLTFLASVAYLVLARDLGAPLVESYVTGKEVSLTAKNMIALFVLVMVSPFCFATSLQSLRFNSLLSLIALFFLSCTFIIRCLGRSSERHAHPPDEPGWDPTREIKWYSLSLSDTLYAVPFFQLSYMCHFNVLPVHMGLRKPTKQRLDHVIFFTVLVAFTFYLIVSYTGYFYSYDHVCHDFGKVSSSTCENYVPDDILNVFDLRDHLVDVGRIGFLCSLMLNFPLLILPCRDTSIRLFQEMTNPRRQSTVSLDDELDDGNDYLDVEFENSITRESPLPEQAHHIVNSPGSPEFTTPMLRRNMRTLNRDYLKKFACCSRAGLVHNFATVAIVSLSFTVMYLVPSVSVVWSITGSSVSMLIGFIFPALFYIKIRSPNGFMHPYKWNARVISAWALLIFAIIMGIVCTYENCRSVFSGDSPKLHTGHY